MLKDDLLKQLQSMPVLTLHSTITSDRTILAEITPVYAHDHGRERMEDTTNQLKRLFALIEMYQENPNA